MGSVLRAVRPIRVFPPTDRTTAQRLRDAPETFDAHLSLIGHDGIDNPDAADECFDVLAELGIGRPSIWTGDVVTAFRFTSEDWTDRYWDTMTWSILKTWKLR